VNVLVDTSVWVEHFKRANDRLVALLHADRVVCHPHVVVEVACGTPPKRRMVIDLLKQLPHLPVAAPDELLELLERRSLAGRGCGFVDVSLLASALISNDTLLWSFDKRLHALAAELGRAWPPGH
jgi:hypothetical protein